MPATQTVTVKLMLPHPGWTNHVGTPNAPTDRYPAEPPAEIGPVLSATTCLSETGSKLGRRIGAKITLTVCMALLAVLIPGSLAWTLSRSLPVGIATAVAVWIGSTWLLLAFVNRRIPACSFLGRDGFARATGTGRRVRVTTLRFSDIADTEVRKVLVTAAGVHVGTRYEFRFVDAHDKLLLQFIALHGRKGPSVETDESFFGLAAVEAWQLYRASARRQAQAVAVTDRV